MRPNYGVDAPGVVRGLLGTAAGLLLLALLAWRLWPERQLAIIAAGLLLAAGIVPLVMGCSMLAYARWGKFRTRDYMLGMVPWSGEERVLDIGTGAGLLLIGAAKSLRGGRAVGIDVWSAKDLSNNAFEVAGRNAAIEGVTERVTVRTADARVLPLEDDSFDRVLSLLCLHNIEPRPDQARACQEIARVLKPGGVAIIGDYVPVRSYATAFTAAGLRVLGTERCFGVALGPMFIVRAEKPAP